MRERGRCEGERDMCERKKEVREIGKCERERKM